MSLTNEYGQPIGSPVLGWKGCAWPGNVVLTGRTCRLEPTNVAKHADQLYAAYSQAPDDRDWTYLPFGPFKTFEEYREHAEIHEKSTDPKYFTIIDMKSDKAIGEFALMCIKPEYGSVEVGFVAFSPLLKRSIQSTEAQYLLMAYVFDQLGYRRYEWRCDSLNAPSRNAAARLGFRFEGVFHQSMVLKNNNSDIAWFGITDNQWPAQKAAFEAWLKPANFDDQGQQIKSLAELGGK